jgi:hypothetical protein
MTKLAPQTPAEGILKVNEWGNSIVYQVECDCTDPDHAHIVEVEANDDSYITVMIYTKDVTKKRNRFGLMWELLTKGHVQREASVIMTEQVAVNYAATLEKAINDMKKLSANSN